ncbi:MAG: capsular biosynthesis protein [Pseudomonadota bacterium]
MISKHVEEETCGSSSNATLLFLQGPPGRFWGELAVACREAGFDVLKINQSLSEELAWRGPAEKINLDLIQWPKWLEGFCRTHSVTDILYYADRQPYHVAAAEVAETLGIRAWVLENGYLRPDWLTFEPFGMSGLSRLPTDASELDRLVENTSKPDLAPIYSHGFWQEGRAEIFYGLVQSLGALRYPSYQTDRYYSPALDYLSWVCRAWQWCRSIGARRRLQERIKRGEISFNLLALQLQSDYQIRVLSPYEHLSEMLREVISSFASSAPSCRHLVVKGHPLDNGWENWPQHLRRLAREKNVEHRVHWLDGGKLEDLLLQTEGLITVNSTVGVKALLQDCPVIALGSAIYNRSGLTHQEGIGSFWQTPTPPDSPSRERFLRALIAWGQFRGSFYDPAGRTDAANAITKRLKLVQILTSSSNPLCQAFGNDNSVVL